MRIIILFLFISLLSNTALAEERLAIVATVGDEAITNKDLLHRLKIIIMSSGQQGDPETVNKLKPQALQELIDERIYLAEAKKLDYNVEDTQVEEAISALEKQNNMPKGGLLGMLSANQVPKQAMNEKLAAEISRAFLVARKVTPKIKVSDDELADFLKAESQVTTRDEFFIKEIVLPLDIPADEPKVLARARELKEKIKSGEDFSSIAKSDSKSSSSFNGGNVGWLDEKQIPPEIMTIIEQQGIGKVLGPIKSIEGYYLVIAAEKRTITTANDNHLVELRQFSKLPKSEAEVEQISNKISSLNNVAEACLRPDLYAQANGVDVKNFGRVRMGDLPTGIRNILNSLETGKFSKNVTIPSGITNFLVCERSENTQNEPTEAQKEQALEFLTSRKTSLEAQKYLRNLRQKTNIDVRL